MKSKYIFIHCKRELSVDTVIYDVYIGSSKREKETLQKLQSITVSNDYYFEKYDNNVSEFLQKIHDSFTDKPYFVCNVPPRQHLTLNQLLQMLKNKFFPSHVEPKGAFAFRMVTNDDFRHKHAKRYGRK